MKKTNEKTIEKQGKKNIIKVVENEIVMNESEKLDYIIELLESAVK